MLDVFKMYIRIDKPRIFGFASVLLALLFSADSLTAQRKVSEADTGRMMWGHSDFKNYDRATMCSRTLDEVTRQYSRIYIKDTSLKPIRDNREFTPVVPDAAIATVKKCIASLNLDNQEADQLWAVARIYMMLGDYQKSRLVAEKAIAMGINSSEKIQLMSQAIDMYLNHSGQALPTVHYFIDLMRSQYSTDNIAMFRIGYVMSNYYYILYNEDSVLSYTNSSIDVLEKMTREEMDSVEAFDPFQLQIYIANINGNISEQERVLERSKKPMSGWRDGRGQMAITAISSGIDTKKIVYNRETNGFPGVIWENYDGVRRPLIGKPSLFVIVNHNCTSGCYSRLNAIKRLKATFGDSLDVVLITQTMGYAPGTGPLSHSEEAKVAAKFFKDFHDLPYTLIVDESPTHKLDDGRIIRDGSPIVQMLGDMGANAIVTDAKGRVQWVGLLRNEWHMRSVTAVVDRALSSRL